MPRLATGLLAALFLCLAPAVARAAPEDDEIAWEKDVSAALAKAKEKGKILVICVNAKKVDGRDREEPAAKGLREVVYRDSRIVTRSRDFVWVMISPKSSVADHGELGNLGVRDPIISPQHIFVNPEGDRVLVRREYWPFGKGEKAIDALLEMMARAERELESPTPPEADPPEAGEGIAPPDETARAEWIQKMLAELDGDPDKRIAAIKALVREDRDGDCTGPLIELLDDGVKDVDVLRSLIRALGVNGLDAAAEPIAEYLHHRDETIRGNAAVSLEHIGCRERKVVVALMKAADREKEEGIANHMFRALGRCGVDENRALALLLKSAASGKSEFATYGPAIGLAYFEGDAKAARGVEKILEQLGIPGGRRGGGQNTVKRGLLSWTLAAIGDERSERFVREELIAGLENVQAFWVDGLRNFWDAVARKCAGEEDAMSEIEGGVRIFVGVARRWGRGGSRDEEGPVLYDEIRKGREASGFLPLGEHLLDGGGGGGWGGRGDGGGGGGDDGGGPGGGGAFGGPGDR